MGSFANSVLTTLLSWVRGAAEWLWSVASGSDGGGFFAFVSSHWKTLLLVLCAVGLVVDLLVYLLRWQPVHVWTSFFRRVRSGKRGMEAIQPAQGRSEPAEEYFGEHTGAEEPQDEEPLLLPEEAPARRRRRQAQYEAERPGRLERLGELLSDEPEERVRLRRVEAATDERTAYHEPYIPPQWKAPGETGTAVRRSRRRRGGNPHE